MSEILKEIRNKIEEVSNTQIKHGVILESNSKVMEKMAENIVKLTEENIIQSKDIAANKESLIDHMEQTRLVREIAQKSDQAILKKLNAHSEDNEVRISKLEKPKIIKKALFDILLKVGGGATAMYGLIRLYDYLKASGILSKIF